MNSRDDFTPKTKEILAKRVGYICSNPDCNKVTIGPQDEPDKTSNIGIAAHITAASKGGPRYDETLLPEERRHINNGIWLCSNCANLIDKDEKKYEKPLLLKWKNKAEEIQRLKLESNYVNNIPTNSIPYLEADLIFSTGLVAPRGNSPKNKVEIDKNGIRYIANDPPIKFWEHSWNFLILIHNNSSFPAYNVRIKQKGETWFKTITKIPTVNNIRPFNNLELKSSYSFLTEETGIEAKKRRRANIPEELIGLEMDIEYFDEARNLHCTSFKILEGGTFENNKK